MAKKKMYQRPDGLYVKDLKINGKRVSFYGHTEKEILQKIAAYEEKEERGPTFEDVANEWWEGHEPRLRYGSVATYRAALERAISYFGKDPIKQIDNADVNAFILYTAQRGFAQKTVSNQLMVLRAIFKHALMQRHIKSMPTDHVSIPPGLQKKARTLAPPSAIDIIKQTSADDFLLPALILYTGARSGEALALQWCDLDFTANTIIINKAVVHHSNRPVISDVKTEAGARTVPLLNPLKKILEQRPQGLPNEYLVGGKEPLTQSAMESQWEWFCRAHGLAHIDEVRSEKAGRAGNAISIGTCCAMNMPQFCSKPTLIQKPHKS